MTNSVNDQQAQLEQLELAKINMDTAKASWQELEVFFARGQIIAVDKQLDLVQVAKQLMDDNKEFFEQQLEQGYIIKPDIDWVKKNCHATTLFWTTVIAPYVLIQPCNDKNGQTD
ncbi:MAG: DUF2288 family protein [Kangiellaceae bacterium]|jgi:hypothetical protein|nr:DUF2288 family protein [Kangiellaceae bacterium]